MRHLRWRFQNVSISDEQGRIQAYCQRTNTVAAPKISAVESVMERRATSRSRPYARSGSRMIRQVAQGTPTEAPRRCNAERNTGLVQSDGQRVRIVVGQITRVGNR